MLVDLNELEQYVLWRRRNKVRIQDIANYMQCSKAYISLFENGKKEFPKWRFNQYIQFMKEHEERKSQDGQ